VPFELDGEEIVVSSRIRVVELFLRPVTARAPNDHQREREFEYLDLDLDHMYGPALERPTRGALTTVSKARA